MKESKKTILIGRSLVLIGILMSINACVSVKPYEKAFVNDEDMEVAPRAEEVFEFNSETYREGASGGAGSKVGGGCGCY